MECAFENHHALDMTLVVLVVVPDGHGRYLIVEERDGTFYLPAGRVDKNEDLLSAAVRETAEEAGVGIALLGVLGFDHEPKRMRFCFVGYPSTNITPKSTSDHHSRGASWLTLAELRQKPLRHHEVVEWIEKYERPRPGFVVTKTEWSLPLDIAGVTLTFKLDRVDALDDGGHAIIDYKAGEVAAPAAWFAQRPRAPQLGLYALALKATTPAMNVRAAAYASLKVGKIRPLGIKADEDAWPDLMAVARLGEPNTWSGVEQRWQVLLTGLARELRDGVATVTPRDNGAPCRVCGLQPLCRIEAVGLRTIAVDDD